MSSTASQRLVEFAEEFGGEVVNASDYQRKGLLDGWFSGWLSEAEENYAG